jgi:hypothetical protein
MVKRRCAKCECIIQTPNSTGAVYCLDCGDLSDLSRSYPFLDLSRRLGVSYGAVLRVSEEIDKMDGDWDGSTRNLDIYYSLQPEEVMQIIAVCRAPWRWQFPPKPVGRGIAL